MKKYVWITVVLLVILMTGAFFAVQEITYAQYAGAEESAQVALNTTVLNKITDVTPYTGGMNGFCIQGKDAAGRDVYVWTVDQKVVAMQYAAYGLSKTQAIAASKKPV